jgi:hypothetical protein
MSRVKTMRIKSIVLWFLAVVLAVFLMHLFGNEMDKSVENRVNTAPSSTHKVSLS